MDKAKAKATATELNMTREQPTREITIKYDGDIRTSTFTNSENLILTKKSFKKCKRITTTETTGCADCGWRSTSTNTKSIKIMKRLHSKVCPNQK